LSRGVTCAYPMTPCPDAKISVTESKFVKIQIIATLVSKKDDRYSAEKSPSSALLKKNLADA